MKLDRLVVPCEVKAAGDSRVIEGYGSVFDVVDLGQDVVVKGAFAKSLTSRNPAMLWQHDRSAPVGVWLDVREDDRGLFMKGEIADTTLGRDAYTLAKMGALTGFSIGYLAPRDKNPVDPKSGIRQLKEIDLWEVSLVTFPMNEDARITGVKAVDMTERQFEEFLRDAGFPIAAAKTIVAHGYRKLRDAASAGDDDMGAVLASAKALSNFR